MPKNQPSQLDPRAQAFVDKLFHYQYAAESARVQMRKAFNITLMFDEIRSEIPRNIAMKRWNELCLYARSDPQTIRVVVGSPTWEEMFKTVDSILEMKPTCIADYFLKNMAADFVVGMVMTFELQDSDPLKFPIINAAEARVHACREELEGPGTMDFHLEFIDKAMQRDLARLINCRMRSVDEQGCQFEFVIKDYGTSYVNGPWVKYRIIHNGKEGKHDIEILADQLDELLKQAKIVSI